MIRQAAGLTFILLLAVGGRAAADAPPGKAIFDRSCAACHARGPGHPGTQRLAELRGATKAVLEERTDLSPAYIRVVVRQGLLEMPPWRPSEIDEAALAQLAQYLAHGHK
jgi:(+)-pinoresinol hydroxylase